MTSTKHDSGFERELRSGLSKLADKAPTGPSPQTVLAALHRRTNSRRIAGLFGGIAAAAAGVVLIVSAGQRAPVVQPPRDTAKVIAPPSNDSVHTARAPRATSLANLLPTHDAAADAALPAYSSMISFASTQVLPSAQASAEWDVSLRLSLASPVEDSWPVIRFGSWR